MRERRLALWLVAVTTLFVGAWAQVSPASFYASFPFGRGWVAADGAYNEHLIRDVGGLTLALAVVTAAAARSMRPALVRLAAGATLLYAVPHLADHASHLEPYGPGDAVANIVALSVQVLIPLWLMISPAPATGSAPPRARSTGPGMAHED
ncbi:MAG TPA: hypothetical protein VK891_11980 [Euzebyales bacterium]|nr:hypothetical protein [Euzebyales bacterium]